MWGRVRRSFFGSEAKRAKWERKSFASKRKKCFFCLISHGRETGKIWSETKGNKWNGNKIELKSRKWGRVVQVHGLYQHPTTVKLLLFAIFLNIPFFEHLQSKLQKVPIKNDRKFFSKKFNMGITRFQILCWFQIRSLKWGRKSVLKQSYRQKTWRILSFSDFSPMFFGYNFVGKFPTSFQRIWIQLKIQFFIPILIFRRYRSY